MLKPSTYIVLATFLITLEIYRIPTPLGFNAAFYHLFLGCGIILGVLSFLLSGSLTIKIDTDIRDFFKIFIIFVAYSFASFIRNLGSMKPESMSMFLSEVIGYLMVLSLPLLIKKNSDFKKVLIAFLASSIFVYFGAFWHIYNFVFLGRYVTEVPFWSLYTESANVLHYLENAQFFMRIPRLRLPFSGPIGAGIFLSFVGILITAYTINSIASKGKISWLLILLNLVNFFCLIGTFARSTWILFFVGCIYTLLYFHKIKLISFKKIIKTLLISSGIIMVLGLILISVIPMSQDVLQIIGMRFSPEATQLSNIYHLRSRLLSLHYWAESPIFGLGIGGFWLKPEGGIHTHSTYFTLLVDRGLIGLILYLVFLFLMFRMLRKRLKISMRDKDKMMLTFNIGFLGVLFGLFVGNLFYQMSSEVVWLFLGIIMTYLNLSTKRKNNLIRHNEVIKRLDKK